MDMEPLMTAKEVEKLYRINLKTLYRWAKNGDIPYVPLRCGHKRNVVRFNPVALRKWLKDREQIGRVRN